MKNNNIQVLVADIGRDQSLTVLLDELGGKNRPIPFYAVYPANGGAPITFDDFPLTPDGLIGYLQKGLDAGHGTSMEKHLPSSSTELVGLRDNSMDTGATPE